MSARSGDALRGEQLATYISNSTLRSAESLPSEVVHEARRALVDYLGVTLDAAHHPAVQPVRRTVERWQASGNARIVLGGTTTPALAALVNSTATHAKDFDDVHYLGAGHLGGPCWSASLAVARQIDADEMRALRAFITGFEVMAHLGGGGVAGVGRSLQRKGFHPTSVLGRMGAAAVVSTLYRLDVKQTAHAMSNSATTSGGLLGSFGSHGKPFHSGKAAMDGILAADLASEGYVGSTELFETTGRSWLNAFIQDGVVEVPPLDFDARWELLRNGYKLFASCRATHASLQTAIRLRSVVAGRRIVHVTARVHPGALITAGNLKPLTGLQAKFSVSFCIAMALSGYDLQASDFDDSIIADETVNCLLSCIELQPEDGRSPASAHLDIWLADHSVVSGETEVILGHPDNPVCDADLALKYTSLVAPVLGKDRAAELLTTAWRFGEPGTLARLDALLAG